MHISRLILNPRSRRVQKEIAEPYEMHRSLMRSFPDNIEIPEEERMLFRVEMDKRTGVPVVLMQSFIEPLWGWLGDKGARDYLLKKPETKSFSNPLRKGQKLAFRLRANPTVKRDGKRYGLYREEEQRDWIERKGDRGGFNLKTISINQMENVYSTIHRNGRTHRITMAAVLYEGILIVNDPDQLWESIQYGIGSGKSMGFGLLSVAPAR